ncbi:hypothetical protein BDR26DRAFT_564971 [Obelidium mucronatum]|nr:hypothetical protein BDR26DRAFT_564971 [Obelidium mucronatum]
MLGDNEAAQATLQATETVETGTCNAKYTQSLEDRLELASLLEAAETKANTLICDIRLIKAEVDALRKIILDSGNGAAIKLMPPPSVLSAFVSGPAPSASSLILNGSGQIASANSEYDDATKEEGKLGGCTFELSTCVLLSICLLILLLPNR